MEGIQEILKENKSRNEAIMQKFDPITGEGSIGERKLVKISDFPIKVQYLPVEMLEIPLVRQVCELGSIKKFLKNLGAEFTQENYDEVVEKFTRIRILHDFPFWCITLAKIKNKDGGKDIPFFLNRPQRRLASKFEKARIAGKPIRVIVVKARQWGGSTCTEMYIAWLQLCHVTSKNAAIIAQGNKAASQVKGMYRRLLKNYPVSMMHDFGDSYSNDEVKIKGTTDSPDISIIPQRTCEITIGSALKPESLRGLDIAFAHLTEVALWKTTDNNSPEEIVRSVVSGISLAPLTMVVYESTANGTGNFFQTEYDSAKNNESNFNALFVAWWQIEKYSQPLENIKEFARILYENKENRNVSDDRHENGRYLWYLWECGATLEAINWYILKRTEYHSHSDMASEYPTDDVEAFKHSGTRVFDNYKVDVFKKACIPPQYIGDVTSEGNVLKGKLALKNLKFSEDKQGVFWIWRKPELFQDEKVYHRYLVVVDIGGRSFKADWSVIVVFDRYFMMEDKNPTVVAQWYGHIDHDLLAWKAAQIAKYYDDALLVIESNTLETKDKERDVDDDQSSFILNQIKDVYTNLYARTSDDDNIKDGEPVKYGFHTNTKTKPEIISHLVEVIREHLYVERDERCLDEYKFYEKKKNGSYGAIKGKHDDLLMTRAIGLWICYRKMPKPYFMKVNVSPLEYNKKVVSEATI